MRIKKKWWLYSDEATQAANNKAVPSLRGSTPNHAIDHDAEGNDVLQLSQQEKASVDLQASQKHADRVKARLTENKAFRRAVQGHKEFRRKGPRKRDPNWEGKVDELDPATQLEGGG